MKTVYLVKGLVTDPDTHPNSKLGDVEWQFSGAPAGQRCESDDYVDLEQGLKDYSGCCIIWNHPQWRNIDKISELYPNPLTQRHFALYVYSVDNNPDGAYYGTDAKFIGRSYDYNSAVTLWTAAVSAAGAISGGKLGLCVRA